MIDSSDRDLIMSLATGEVSGDEFIRLYREGSLDFCGHLKKLLEDAFVERNADDVEYALLLGFSLHLFSRAHSEVICKLITEDWHRKHEDMAAILQDLKDPSTVDCLYAACSMNFAYLDYDESYSLAVKCIWALGAINAPGSRQKLQDLARSENKIVRENAQKQLARFDNTGFIKN